MGMTASEKESIRLRYLEVDTSNVADVLDNMNLLQQGLAADFGPYPETCKR
ncbi:MAG: RraA family protein, partial [Burkholderiaceae bacterium]|nr:RraA family protein [Burkholderiaceae bacterium]